LENRIYNQEGLMSAIDGHHKSLSTSDAIAYQRRNYVIDRVGWTAISSFEKWAFDETRAMIYDDHKIMFKWRSARGYISEETDADKLLGEIIDLWNQHLTDR